MTALAVLLLAVLPAAPLRADYLVTGIDGRTFRADSYWVQGGKMHFPEGQPPVNVYDVRSVTPENLSPEKERAREAAMDAFFRQVSELEETEKALAAGQAETLKKISVYPVGKREAIDPEAKQGLEDVLEVEEEKAAGLMSAWREMKLPDFGLLRARDVKTLQLLSLESSISQAYRYVRTGDPSYYEYAEAHLIQYIAFMDTFTEALGKAPARK
ncbi:MAG TPA: hypothetical protein PKM41_00915 [Deltaproteobacteria bacterium]|nr:hypothetical protein [Deltaproteobacteria bacterium]HOI06641.1 hypothetical protein [Deltaproteobacteria bacterium]